MGNASTAMTSLPQFSSVTANPSMELMSPFKDAPLARASSQHIEPRNHNLPLQSGNSVESLIFCIGISVLTVWPIADMGCEVSAFGPFRLDPVQHALWTPAREMADQSVVHRKCTRGAHG
jgi:hypothetical protein